VLATSRTGIAAALVAVVTALAPVAGQELLDRVVARVGATAITLSDVRAAIVLGLVAIPAGADPVEGGTDQLLDRQLVLAEVERFPPAEPSPEAIAAEQAALLAAAGGQLPALVEETGFDEARIAQTARDSARIEAYLAERFGTNLPVSDDDVARYYEEHLDEFLEGGVVQPLDAVEAQARAGASDERRQALIDDWVDGLRTRAAVIVLEPPGA